MPLSTDDKIMNAGLLRDTLMAGDEHFDIFKHVETVDISAPVIKVTAQEMREYENIYFIVAALYAKPQYLEVLKTLDTFSGEITTGSAIRQKMIDQRGTGGDRLGTTESNVLQILSNLEKAGLVKHHKSKPRGFEILPAVSKAIETIDRLPAAKFISELYKRQT